MKIKIYCLIDKSNNHPFYVGATKRDLKQRLSGHKTELVTYKHCLDIHEKWLFMVDLIKNGTGPEIILLHECTLYDADFYEYFFYKMFVQHGYKMMNDKHVFIIVKSILIHGISAH